MCGKNIKPIMESCKDQFILAMIGGAFLELVGLNTLMFIASFLAGILPMKLTISKEQFNYISLVSMGILIGTSFQLIIPEGIEVLFESDGDRIREELPRYAGMSLLFGFVLMFIIDNTSGIFNCLHINATWSYYSPGNDEPLNTLKHQIISVFQTSTTIGLVLHSLIDGISLGSSFLHRNNAIKMVLFLVIIIHKLPTSFSLSSILLKEGFTSDTVKIHLITFSLAAPIASMATYVIMLFFKFQGNFTIGILFLFSGGAFFYVVVHVMGELLNSRKEISPPDTENNNTGSYNNELSLSGVEILCSLGGILVPIVVSMLGDI